MAIVRQYTMTYTAVELLGERETIEKNIEDELRAAIAPYGIVMDDVLVKDIDQVAKMTELELQTKRNR